MTTTSPVLNRLQAEKVPKVFRWQFAQSHPVLTFLLITFAWTWLFWLAAIPLRGKNDLLVMMIVLIGGYGPAIGGILTLGLRNGLTLALSWQQLLVMLTAAAIFALLVVRYQVGTIPSYDSLPENLALSGPIVIAALCACLVGGWVIANALASNADIREKMASILPSRLPWRWTFFALFFFPALLLISWGSAAALGLAVEYPALWGHSLFAVLPLGLLAFLLTALARGGMEEPGWRGMMQPTLQNKFSPLVASLIVAVFWSLWHLPLFFNGFYPAELVTGMTVGGVYRILLAIFLTWFYNRSGGNLFLLVFLHTSFNVMVNYIPFSEPVLAALWLMVAVVVVMKDKMYQKLPAWRGTRNGLKTAERPQTTPMKNALTNLLKQHAVIAYFVLAYALSWAVELPLVASAQGWLQVSVPPALHYLAAFGPLFAALIITAATEGSNGIRQLFAGLWKWRVGLGWVLFAILSPVALFGVAAIVGYATSGTWPDLALLGEVDYLPYLGVGGAFLLWLLTFGVGEEVGWRGFALPRLQQKYSALTATFILGVVWAFWHLPAFFYKDTYMAMGLIGGLPMLLLSILAASIIFTWLYNSTRGSLLTVILFHALFDFLSVSRAGGGSVAAIMSAGVMIWAVLVVILFKPMNLAHEQKQTA